MRITAETFRHFIHNKNFVYSFIDFLLHKRRNASVSRCLDPLVFGDSRLNNVFARTSLEANRVGRFLRSGTERYGAERSGETTKFG